MIFDQNRDHTPLSQNCKNMVLKVLLKNNFKQKRHLDIYIIIIILGLNLFSLNDVCPSLSFIDILHNWYAYNGLCTSNERYLTNDCHYLHDQRLVYLLSIHLIPRRWLSRNTRWYWSQCVSSRFFTWIVGLYLLCSCHYYHLESCYVIQNN